MANASHSRSFTPARGAQPPPWTAGAGLVTSAWRWRRRRRRRFPRFEERARIVRARLASSFCIKPRSSGVAILRTRERLRESCARDSVAFSCVLADVAASRMARRRSARSAATLSMRNFSRATRESATRVLCGAELYRSSRGSPPCPPPTKAEPAPGERKMESVE